MLTDEEILKIAADTKTGEPGLHGYILPISFAREIERAVLAKALAQQERLHKEWSELWSPIDEAVRPLTPLGESVAAKALELINTAKAMQKQEPIYMWRLEDDGWMECTKEFFDAAISAGYEKRIVYPAPQPAQAAAMPEKLQDIEIPKDPTNGEKPYIWIAQQEYVRGWNDCRDAMLSASPKPDSI